MAAISICTHLVSEVDEYLTDVLDPEDEILRMARRNGLAAGIPMHASVTPLQGQFLQVLTRGVRAKRVLEIGTLGGYGALCLARGLVDPGTGCVLTLELDEARAEVARDTIRQAGLAEVVEVRTGPAVNTLHALIAQHAEPFDLIFVDADKGNNPTYFELGLQLSRPGTMLVFDNVVRGGDILDADSPDRAVQGVRKLLAMLKKDPRVDPAVQATANRKHFDAMAYASVL
jgi:predicted O-methyltransferase YrrM